MSVIINRDTFYYTDEFAKNAIVLEANNYLLMPFKFSGDWNEIRIGVECYVADAHNYTGTPLVEFEDGDPYQDANMFYFGIKRNDNPDQFLPEFSGNTFIGYISSTYWVDSPDVPADFASCCVPTVSNDPNTCASGNIAPITSDVYRIVSADTGYFYTLNDENCNPTTTCDNRFRYAFRRDVEVNGSGNNLGGGRYIGYSDINDFQGFIAMASGVPSNGGYISRNGMTINIYNRGQTGQMLDISMFNNPNTDPDSNSPQINLLRDFLTQPSYYYWIDNNYFNLDFSPSGAPSIIPDNLFIYWPFKKNVLVITDIVVEKFA